MQMGMIDERLSPRVEHGEEPDRGAQVLGVGCDGAEGLGDGSEEDAVDHRVIVVGDRRDLCFGASLETLRDRATFTRHLVPARRAEWVVYAKAPFASPQQVLDYVGRYPHRVAISNNRLLDIDDGHVRFRYKDYRADRAETQKVMTLPATEFIRRFLLHVLPAGFHRIRYYGLLGNRHRKDTIARCRQLLGTAAPATSLSTVLADDRDRYEALTGISLQICPVCQQGHMLVIEHVPRAYGRVAIPDSS